MFGSTPTYIYFRCCTSIRKQHPLSDPGRKSFLMHGNDKAALKRLLSTSRDINPVFKGQMD